MQPSVEEEDVKGVIDAEIKKVKMEVAEAIVTVRAIAMGTVIAVAVVVEIFQRKKGILQATKSES